MRLLVTVTLNPNQLRAHLEPIWRLEEVESITLVADRAAPEMPKLRSVVPPAWLVRVLGRAAAKLVTAVVVARRERPAWVLAYNLVPHGLNALIVGALARRRTLLHLIGGPREWEGGGYTSDNAILGRLRRPVAPLEGLLLAAIRRASFVSVMGSEARRLLIEAGVRPERVTAIPASVDLDRFRPRPPEAADYGLITVSQLIPRKRLADFIDAVALLRERHPALRAAIVGTGPLEAELRAHAERRGVADAVDMLGFRADIEQLYARSEIFVLPSRSEGLSIAVTEAMATGLPVVVTDVGEVRDIVEDGRNGFLFAVGDTAALAEHADRLLSDPDLRRSCAQAAAADAGRVSARERIEGIYRQVLTAGRFP